MKAPHFLHLTTFVLSSFLFSCKSKTAPAIQDPADSLHLKRGDIIVCGPPEKQYGTVSFATSCSAKTKKDFDLAISMLHSFEYDEAEKVFAKVIDEDPNCAMAYWGVAMSNYHQVWPTTPTDEELAKGWKTITLAQSLPGKTAVESAHINAMATFYKDWKTVDHKMRNMAYAHAMEDLYKTYPTDKEVAVFYALSLVSSANPADKTYSNQKKAGNKSATCK